MDLEEGNMKKEILRIKPHVLKLLEKYPETRNCDKELIFRFLLDEKLCRFTLTEVIIEKADIPKMPNFESIRRSRAHIQNEMRLFLPTDPVVLKLRRLNQDDMNEIPKWISGTEDWDDDDK